MANPDNNDFRTPSQTDSSTERDERPDAPPLDLGLTEIPDSDDIGDIADETPGHRG